MSAHTPSLRVRAADPARESILGHIMRSLIRRATGDARVADRLGRYRHTIGLRVSGMEVAVELKGEEIVVHSGTVGEPKAVVESDMITLLAVACGGSLLGAWLRRRLRVRGNPLRLLPLLPLLRPGSATAEGETS